MNVLFAIAGVVITELCRRKDFYVLFILTALITLFAGAMNFFDEKNIVRYVKEIALHLIWFSSLVIAIPTAARQIPAELENKTLFPLLAKPVSRAQLVFGKFLGCWLACAVVLVVFYLFLGAISGAREHAWPLLSYVKAMGLHWFCLAIVIAMTLLGSVIFSTPASNSTFTFIVVMAILLMGRYLNIIALQLAEPGRTVLYTIYFAIPHLEWFNVGNLLVHDIKMVSWIDIAIAVAYAAVYSLFFLCVACQILKRKRLT